MRRSDFFHCVGGSSASFCLFFGYCISAIIKLRKFKPHARGDELLKTIKTKMNVNHLEVRCIEGSQGVAQALGLPGVNSTLHIYLNNENICEDELEFFIAHELAHLQTNDVMRLTIYSLVVGISVSMLLFCMFPSARTSWNLWKGLILGGTCRASCGGNAASAMFIIWYSRMMEMRADTFAIQACSISGQKAAQEFFASTLAANIWAKNHSASFFRSKCISANGDYWADILHPRVSTRLKNLQILLDK